MIKILLSIFLIIILLPSFSHGQPCEITEVHATTLPCDDHLFLVTIDLQVNNPSSPGFTLAGNGVIYGTYLYSDLPVTVGPLYGDNQSVYEFIAWDVENPACQNFTTLDAADCGPICSFDDFVMDSIICLNSEIAAVMIDFTYENVSGLTYDLYYANGTYISSYLYASLPQSVLNFRTNGAAPITVKVCDHENSSCCQTFTVDAIDCSVGNCEIYNVSVDPECVNSNFVVHLDFDIDHPASDSFTVTGNSLNYGIFGYNELPIILGPLNGNTSINWEFTIKDSELLTCATVAHLGIYHCPPPCDILALEANAIECNGDDAFALEVDMEIEGEGDGGYSLFSNDYFYGTYSYDDLPNIIPDFAVNQFIDQVTVCDNDHPGCCQTTLFEALLCNGCLIYNLEADPLPCDNNGEFFISIDFDYQNVSDQGFTIEGNGNNLGNFQYEDLPILLGPYLGNGSYYFEFVVSDLLNDFCFDATEVGTLPCGSICEISNLAVEQGECTGNNLYILHVNFDHTGSTSQSFDLFANGEFYDNYNYSELPLTLLEFPSNGTGFDSIRVCDNDNNDCCASIVFESPDCQCSIFETTVEVLDCTSDSTFAVSVEFFSENLPGNSVDVFIDGIFIGTHNIDNLPFIVDNVPEGDGGATLTICGHEAGDCCDDVFIELINCEGPQCNIWDLFAVPGQCTSDSTYIVDVIFNHAFLPSDSVNIWANDHFVGTYFIDPNFIHIENFPVLDGNTTTVSVCAVGNNDCCDTYIIETPDCNPLDCEISGLIVVPGDCNSDSTYHLVLEYNGENIQGDSVTVTVNGNSIGTFFDPDHRLEWDQFPWMDGTEALLTVCSFANPDCCDSYEYTIPNCPDLNACHIYDLVVEVGDCQTDSTYILIVDFQYDHLPTDSVVITANEEAIGTYQIHEGHIILQQFPVFDANHTIISVCALGSPDCCDTYEFETPDCEGGNACHIYNLTVGIGDCNSDSTYVLELLFQFDNLPTDSVIITANDVFIGQFQAHEEQYHFLNFPVFESNHTVIQVCAVGAPDCCDTYEFETPDCGGGNACEIFDLVTHIGDCLTDSTYVLTFDFQFNHLPSDSVVITANEQTIGHFQVHEGHIVIDQFPVFNANHTIVTVCAIGSPDCCDTYEFETPNCENGGTCNIYELFAETGICTSDSTFLLDIVFYWSNLPTDSVLIYANGHFIGTYHTPQPFIRIENFPLFDGGTTHLLVCALGAPDCCEDFDFNNPTCGGGNECSIYDVAVQTLECNSDSTFGVMINFQYQNIPSGGFDVYSGDAYLGFFPFDQVPIAISNFPSNGSGEYIVTICPSDHFDCCTIFEFEGPVCAPGACDLYGMEWAMTPCDSAGNFFFILNFNTQNVGTEGFHVVGNGNNYGNFSYSDLPITLGPFPSDNTFFEFAAIDNQFNDCTDVVVPGDVECFVGTSEINKEEIYAILNNGSIPGIFVKKELTLSLYNSNGKMLLLPKPISAGAYIELNSMPSGIYIAIVQYEGNIWPVKLVKGGY